MRLLPNIPFLAKYWTHFEDYSYYEGYFDVVNGQSLLVTKSANLTVGALWKKNGAILILPSLDFSDIAFTEMRDEEELWTNEAVDIARKFVECSLDIDAYLREDIEKNPPPDWVASDEFRLDIEIETQTKIIDIDESIQNLENEKALLRTKLEKDLIIKGLLYEKGRALEVAVREALSLLGFDVSTFKDEESEFDAIFSSEEGRFIGEIEGKDTKPINVDKHSQLERNINEDFARDSVSERAIGVLFGNAFRVNPVNDRGEFFTQKVISSATRASTVLIRTPDLFFPAIYLRKSIDIDYAHKCRQAILASRGSVVIFPPVPGV